MAYIGNTSLTTNIQPATDFFSGNGSTVSFTLSRTVVSAFTIEAVINNVQQNPSNAYAVSGNTITFTSAPPTGTNNIYVNYNSIQGQVVGIGQGTVGPSQMSTGGPTWDINGNTTVGGNLTASGNATFNGTGALKIPTGTTAQRPTGQAGVIRFNTTNNQLETFLTSTSEWSALIPKLGTVTRPATSARAIFDAGDSVGDGVYYIQSASGVIPVYCDMTNGGYMLVAKISSTLTNNWLYNGSYWTGTNPVNETGVQTLANEDSVSRLYYEFTLQLGFRICLGAVSNFLLEAKTGGTARSFFTGSQSGSQNSRAQFLSWFQTGTGQASSNFDNQPFCNTAGFNVTNVSATGMRWGITMNNENDCASNDSAVGMGTFTNNWFTPAEGVRNVGAGGHRWNPDARYTALGFIFVR